MNNAELVTKAIEDMNRERERVAESTVRSIIAQIIARQEAARKIAAELVELKKQLAEVKIEPVNAADIVG